MSTPTLLHPTQFSGFDIERRNIDSTEFTAAPLTAWPDLATQHRSLFRTSIWRYLPTESEHSQSAELVLNWLADAEPREEESTGAVVPGWRMSFSLMETSDEDANASRNALGDDRRVYALAAVQKLQRLFRLTQDQVADLVGVSRPTLWNWMQGRVPQERSLRGLYAVTGTVDLMVSAFGGEETFNPDEVAARMGLDRSILERLAEPGGPRALLEAFVDPTRVPATISLLPTADELADAEFVEETARPSAQPRVVRPVTRRSR